MQSSGTGETAPACLFDLARHRLIGTRPFAFVHVPKTAGTSIRSLLGEPIHESIKMGDIGTARAYRHLVGEQRWDRAFKFGFVRNPWDRAVSLWQFICVGSRQKPRREFGAGRETSFRDFLEGIEEPAVWETWHMASQLFHLVDENGAVMVDFIGRFERLQQDFDEVCDRIGLARITLPHVNSTGRGHYADYYDDTTVRLVAQRYGDDIERFGYRFGE